MSRKTRVVQSLGVGDHPKWVCQYFDPTMDLWFDIGDAKVTREEALAVQVRETEPPEYSDVMKAIAERYDERVLAILEGMRRTLLMGGYDSVEPYQMWDDTYRWAFATKNEHDVVAEGSFDFTFELVEQRANEGEGAGINWSLDITKYGGELVGGLSPFNYTDEVWVDSSDAEAVEARFILIESAEAHDLVTLLDDNQD
jgi:hypothetical protein